MSPLRKLTLVDLLEHFGKIPVNKEWGALGVACSSSTTALRPAPPPPAAVISKDQPVAGPATAVPARPAPADPNSAEVVKADTSLDVSLADDLAAEAIQAVRDACKGTLSFEFSRMCLLNVAFPAFLLSRIAFLL